MKMIRITCICIALVSSAYAQTKSPAIKQVEEYTSKQYPSLEKLYRQLHQNPELSLHEEKTAKIMAEELRTLGFDVIEKLGGQSLVGILKNGKGPTVLIRTDMDALPLEEKTGLPYASKARGINAVGADVPVMHACGHDIHMTVFVGTARALTATRKQWKGTLIMVAQSSEENGFGADMLFKAGLYDTIPKPDYAIALHDNASLEAGKVGYHAGAFMASVDMMNITVHGKGGHGAAPHTTIDPVVLSAEMILAFQTIVSREINPLEPAVITVGSIHGGSVHNIIPDDVKLQLTLRSYSPEVRQQIIAAIHKKSEHLALQAGVAADKLPEITINDPQTPATINDVELTNRLVQVFQQQFGKENVVELQPAMVGEDFSRFGLQDKKVPICMFWLGAVDPAKVKQAKEQGVALPSLHSSTFIPLPEPTIKTGVAAMSAAALNLFGSR
ncbi:MAG TPA: amidohydrolase [Ohtaekwangia sp.]|uniref:amidohydrolase n=1 Tax=Ohtaekwangia sp. TaxID=2066019 RepID=UPI002F9342FD